MCGIMMDGEDVERGQKKWSKKRKKTPAAGVGGERWGEGEW